MTLSEGLRAAWPRHRRGVSLAILGSLSLGLAPYVPHPHVYKQLRNLAEGTLTASIDVFDLLMHGAPWVALGVLAGRWIAAGARAARA